MLITKVRYESELRNTEYELQKLRDRVWELSRRYEERYTELYRRYDLLLNHLGLSEYSVPAKFELKPKGGA